MSTYTTRQGDMWDLISFRLTGTPDQIVPIMQANPEYTRTYIFPAGVVLQIPDLDSIVDMDAIPPWKQI